MSRYDHPGLLRLLQLVSPSLPIGSFTYSQGIEWAVEAGWIDTPESLRDWLKQPLEYGIARLDLPLLKRFYAAAREQDKSAMSDWIDYLNASRETAELLQEEKNRGRALVDLLISLNIPLAKQWKPLLAQNFLAAFAVVACYWDISEEQAAQGYVWSWLENQVLSAIKIIPLGQTQGQVLLSEMLEDIAPVVATGLSLKDEQIGASSPALAIASAQHETQYTRLFRS